MQEQRAELDDRAVVGEQAHGLLGEEEQGRGDRARDGEGRTALVCAVRYNPSPSAARALIKAGADTRARFNGNTLRRLLRFNPRMSERDKKTLVPLLKGKSAQ